jgi:hypothetical protein
MLHSKTTPGDASSWRSMQEFAANLGLILPLANKMARTVWGLVAHGRAYRSEWKSTPPCGCGAQAQAA